VGGNTTGTAQQTKQFFVVHYFCLFIETEHAFRMNNQTKKLYLFLSGNNWQ
jgi:RecA/RadA recombinase